MTALSYAAEQVRRYDHDRFLTVIFAPKAVREHLFALYAFNIEIAKTGEVVTDSLIGLMRLQWWRDVLDRIYAGDSVAHQVAQPLADAVRSCRLPRASFDRLIDAREADLDAVTPPDMISLRAYAEATSAPLLALAVAIVAPGDRDVGAIAPAVTRLGTAWALTGLLRAVPFHARRRRLLLPLDLLDDAKVRPGQIFDLQPPPALAEVIAAIAGEAAELILQARDRLGAIPKSGRSPLLLARLAELYLADLRRAGWNPFALEAQPGHPLAAIRLALTSLIGRY